MTFHHIIALDIKFQNKKICSGCSLYHCNFILLVRLNHYYTNNPLSHREEGKKAPPWSSRRTLQTSNRKERAQILLAPHHYRHRELVFGKHLLRTVLAVIMQQLPRDFNISGEKVAADSVVSTVLSENWVRISYLSPGGVVAGSRVVLTNLYGSC